MCLGGVSNFVWRRGELFFFLLVYMCLGAFVSVVLVRCMRISSVSLRCCPRQPPPQLLSIFGTTNLLFMCLCIKPSSVNVIYWCLHLQNGEKWDLKHLGTCPKLLRAQIQGFLLSSSVVGPFAKGPPGQCSGKSGEQENSYPVLSFLEPDFQKKCGVSKRHAGSW